MTGPLSDQQLDEILAHVPNCRYGCDACEAFPALAKEVKRLRGENEQLADLDDAATRRSELQAERDRAVARWHEEHRRAEKAETELDSLRRRSARALADRQDEYDSVEGERVRLAEQLGARDAELAATQVELEGLRAAYDRLGAVSQPLTDHASRFRAERDLLHDTLAEALGAIPAGHERAEAWLAVLASVPCSEEP